MNFSLSHGRFVAMSTFAASMLVAASAWAQTSLGQDRLQHVVDGTIKPLMERNAIPGMAVAVIADGKQFVFNYGLASQEGGQKVTDSTLFEMGSISKTFTATLAAYGVARGAFSLSDKAGQRLPALAGSDLDNVSLLDLATYTAGGLPLQFPDEVTDDARMIAYYKAWHPAFPPGTHRLYSNPSIGLFGYLAAGAMGKPFDDLMQTELLPLLGLSNTYVRVPQERMADYAWGITKDGRPIRVSPGPMDAEAYGIKTTATDLIRFVEANINGSRLDETLRRAIAATHVGYYKVGVMQQGLGWEMYTYPTTLERLLAGNSAKMAFEPHEAHKLMPPQPARRDMLFNKTGSTNGFGGYVAYVPARGIGIAILANKNYPIPDRIKAAWQILSALDGQKRSASKP
ncbi:class C beta-lactamase [Labrys sp. WJW]|uniref:class C beta-lactamase n=1 Tax=Labrys sp. WJW TaxID=1737983 RepID=UPI00083008AA|nr:class C beta-lactamase [Labrys sp. WJW]